MLDKNVLLNNIVFAESQRGIYRISEDTFTDNVFEKRWFLIIDKSIYYQLHENYIVLPLSLLVAKSNNKIYVDLLHIEKIKDFDGINIMSDINSYVSSGVLSLRDSTFSNCETIYEVNIVSNKAMTIINNRFQILFEGLISTGYTGYNLYNKLNK